MFLWETDCVAMDYRPIHPVNDTMANPKGQRIVAAFTDEALGSSAPCFRLQALGPFSLVGEGGPVNLGSKKLCGLVAFLACAASPQRRERLMSLLWGSHFQLQAQQNLRKALFRLRRALGADIILSNDEVVWLRPGAMTCDAEVVKAKSFTIDGEAVVLGPDGLSRFEELSHRETARTAILYAFDLIEHDGEDLRNLPFLDRKAALARLLRETEAGIPAERTHRGGWGDRVRPCVPAWRRGYRFEADRQYLPVRPVPCLDQGPQSHQHRRAAGAKRDLESTSLRQRTLAMTCRNSKFGACRVRRSEARDRCAGA
jgi:hypothetical protein